MNFVNFSLILFDELNELIEIQNDYNYQNYNFKIEIQFLIFNTLYFNNLNNLIIV